MPARKPSFTSGKEALIGLGRTVRKEGIDSHTSKTDSGSDEKKLAGLRGALKGGKSNTHSFEASLFHSSLPKHPIPLVAACFHTIDPR